ncbi:MAG: MaoC family dehydratase [Desulfarculaceae bacterium]|nr:MaoC family dehydratase [Desulfarculaceae bacterium]MCF8073150.1 MaoC family dehydratase [Desulfarculaceae bacterium]MCF8101765.1 MaoC family dehydratase [Desulfarculaceae bacterium]MCF8118397.1 MaoC family dehydratase [Desulfarculaceae bacterium]
MTGSAKQLVAGSKLGPEKMEMTLEKMRTYENWPAVKNVHCDEQVAKEVGFSQPICRAVMFSAAADKMLYSTFGPAVLTGNKLSLKYLKAMLPGDTCVAHGEVKSVTEIPGHINYSIDIWLENQDQEKVASGEAEVSIASA